METLEAPKNNKKKLIIGSAILVLLLIFVFIILRLISTGGSLSIESPEFVECDDCTIKNVSLSEPTFYPEYGDLWSTAWAEDNNLYMIFGDGSGLKDCIVTEPEIPTQDHGRCLDYTKSVEGEDILCGVIDCEACITRSCPFTPAGVLVRSGPVDSLLPCEGENCLVSRDIPYGNRQVDEFSDKPSSLIAISGVLYAGMHEKPEVPVSGYVAYSRDKGKTWTKVENSPWTGDSPFKILMYINMGQNYNLNRDGFVYALGIQNELNFEEIESQEVFLTRVQKNSITDYNSYEYYVDLDGENAIWSKNPAQAQPVPGLHTVAKATAMYHAGTDRYLFLSGFSHASKEMYPDLEMPGGGSLFESPTPWGPWREVARFPALYIPSFIPKDAGPDHVYFAAAGSTVPYSLNIIKMNLSL